MSQPARSGPVAVVLDHTALLAAGTGSRLVSRLIDAAHRDTDLYLYAPAMCVAAATAVRPELGTHLGRLDAVRIVDLDYPGALTAGASIADGADWRGAHAVTTARPTPEWPTGRPIVTATPDEYAAWGVQTIGLQAGPATPPGA